MAPDGYARCARDGRRDVRLECDESASTSVSGRRVRGNNRVSEGFPFITKVSLPVRPSQRGRRGPQPVQRLLVRLARRLV